MEFLFRLFGTLADFVFPRSKQVLELEKLSVGEILDILPPSSPIEDSNIIALFDYSHPLVREIIWSIKYRGDRNLADKMGQILADTLEQEISDRKLFEQFDTLLLVPMPISDKRRFERGWNQSELLAKAVKKHSRDETLRYTNGQLVKYRHTDSQTHASNKSERQKNLKDSMKVMNPLVFDNKSVILLDDVITTGSTFAEAKRALKEAGVKKIICIALAH